MAEQHPSSNGVSYHHHAAALPPPMSEGARLTFRDLQDAGVVLPPVPEENHMPHNHSATLHRGYAGPNLQSITVLPPSSSKKKNKEERPPPLCLLREQGATQAYARTSEREIHLTDRHPHWGCVFFGVIYYCVQQNERGIAFQAPEMDSAEHVAIKRLNKTVVHQYLSLGCEENPYKEVARMEELGDNIHVLKVVEFLEDDNYLYIITPKACAEGTLKDVIPFFKSQEILDDAFSRKIFRKILAILGYLERRGINHHDLSPDNLLFLTPDNLVVFDLALSLRIPVNPATGQRALIAPQRRFGTMAFMCPEVYHQQVFDGVAMDLYSAALILYNLQTNQLLFPIPDVTNISFAYFVFSEGLWHTDSNERAIELIHRIYARNDANHQRMQNEIFEKANLHLKISPEAMELLENLLKVNPADRWSLAQAMESAYVQALDD